MSDFSHLKAGDLVVVNGRYHRTLNPIIKVTKTQIHTSTDKFRVSDGRLIGDLYRLYIEKATPELVEELKNENWKNRLVIKLDKTRWVKFPLTALQAIDKIISEHTEP